MAATSPEGSEAEAAQPLELLSGFEAVERLERLICGRSPARHPALAEGLALAGLRAASSSDARDAAGEGTAVPGASCVHHVRGTAGRGAIDGFELAASSAQEAVDLSLVGHLLSRRLGRAGVCSLAPALGSELGLLRVPGPDLVSSLLDANSEVPEGDAGRERILELAREAFHGVSERTGRSLALVDGRVGAATELALVGSGAEAERARELAEMLCDAGVSADAVAVLLVRPFPEQEVADALAGARRVFVLDDPDGGGALLASVRVVCGDDAEVHPLSPAPPARMIEALAKHLPGLALDPERHAPLPDPLRHRLVVSPAGAWGEETARRVAAATAHLGALRVAPTTRRHLGATVLAWGGDALPGGMEDLLLASHPALLGRRGALALVRPKGAAVVLSGAGTPEELARELDPESREELREREIELHWVNPPETTDDAPDGVSASFTLAGAALSLLSPEGPAEAAAGLEAAGLAQEGALLRAGAQGVRTLKRDDLDPRRLAEEVDFRPAANLPRVPDVADDPEARALWAERIRRFHLTGRGAFSAVPELPARPAALRGLAPALRSASPHPFVLVPTDDPAHPTAARGLRDLIADAVLTLQGGGPAMRVLSDNVERLALLGARLLARRAPGATLGPLLAEASAMLVDELDLADDERPSLEADLASLAGALPDEGVVFELRRDTPLRLYLTVLESVRAPLRKRFTEELEGLRERLQELLQLDEMKSTAGRSPEAVAASLGGSAQDLLDPAALSLTLARTKTAEPLGPERRERIERSLASIEEHLAQSEQLAVVVLLRSPGAHPGVRVEQLEHPDPLAAAVGVFDGLASRMAALFRAVRVARLEVAGTYRPELHDEHLAHLTWEGFSADELLLVPQVAVSSSGRRLRQRDQGSLSQLLRSSRPVHVIIQDEVAAPDETEDLSLFHVDLGYLVVAHREALAIRSSLARPEPLTEGLVRAAQALRPAVVLMNLPSPEPVPRRALLAEAALQGRACSDFRYDPDAGPSWADRLDLTSNPQPDRPWPLHSVAYLAGEEQATLEVPFTFVDAVASEPGYLRHLQMIPPVAWDDEVQLPLAEYLGGFEPAGRERAVPFLWVIDEGETLQRAILTRELAAACADRLRAWRTLQELAGYDNVFAERAASAARDRALSEAEAERSELERAHAEELERVREAGARESMDRLAAVLMNPEGMAAMAPSPTVAPTGAPPPPVPDAIAEAPPVAAEPEAPVEEEEEASLFDEPYIDSPLCTTCNECTNLNSQLFAYNEDKQAFIADATAGTFAELVKSAEMCPARCIHPGKPRGGDSTATPEMIERAAPFNA